MEFTAGTRVVVTVTEPTDPEKTSTVSSVESTLATDPVIVKVDDEFPVTDADPRAVAVSCPDVDETVAFTWPTVQDASSRVNVPSPTFVDCVPLALDGPVIEG